MDYDRPPPPEGQAAAIAAGRTVMWCDWPVLDGRTTVDEHLCIEGWAYCEQELEEVVVLVDGQRHVARHGLPRADVDERLTTVDRHVSGFMHVLDTRDWTPGPHDLSVVAVGRDGRAVGQGGTVTCGRDLPYRAWRERAGYAMASTGASSAQREGLPLIICVLETGAAGAPLAASLKRQSHRNWSRAGDGLGVTLNAIARGEGAGVLVEDSGFLAPMALAWLAAAMNADPPADIVYADEDAVAADGGRGAAFLKPGWSPELLLSTDYVGPLVGVSARAARSVLEGAPDPPATIYDLLLRVVDTPMRVQRVAEVLFTSHRPRVPSDDARVRSALERLGARRGRDLRIRPLELPGTRELSWDIDGEPLVSLVIPTSYSRELVRQCLRSIREQTTYENLEVVIVDSSSGHLASAEPELAALEHRVVSYEGEFNFSTAVNRAAQAARGDYLVLLNDDTEVRSPDWVEKMLAQAQAPGVGVVGCRLSYPDGRVQHGGVAVHEGIPWHLYLGFPADAPGYRGMLGLVRNYSAVTGACMLVSSALFAELGGFDESMAINYADTDFCLRAVDAGQRVVWTPHAVLVHHERSSFSPRAGWRDFERFNGRWSPRYAGGDPYYHPAFMPSLYYELRPEGPGRPSAPPLSDLEPFPPPPRTADVTAAISSGRPVMWCDEPELDTGLATFGFLRVSGWAYSKGGAEVFVYLDGRPYEPRLGMIRHDLSRSFGGELRDAGFSVQIDLDAHRAGPLELVVAASSAEGTIVGVRGEVECRPTPPAVRPPDWEAPGAVGAAAGEVIDANGWYQRALAWEERALVAEARIQAHRATQGGAEDELERAYALQRLEVKRLRGIVRKTRKKLEREKREAREARNRARRYEASLSWRLTGPVRGLLGLAARRVSLRRPSSRDTRAPTTAESLTVELKSPPRWMYPWQLGKLDEPRLIHPELPSIHQTRLELIEEPARRALAAAGDGATAIDLACSEGWFSHRLLEWGASRAVGVDLREVNVRRARLVRDHLGVSATRLELFQQDVSQLDPPALGEFDIVLLLGLIYHVEDPVGVLRRARHLTRGVCLIETQLTRQDEPVRWGNADHVETSAGSFAAHLEADAADNPIASAEGSVALIPNRAAVEMSARAAGFGRVEWREPMEHHDRQYRGGDRGVLVAWPS